MSDIAPLPENFIDAYREWHKTDYAAKGALFADLVDNGQHPQAMIISCCDSRVHPTGLFGADEGTFFVHRNIANLVPPYKAEGDNDGTAAALQYAVTALRIPHILVIGHSQCGGVQGCHDMFSGKIDTLSPTYKSLDRWLAPLRPAYERVSQDAARADNIHALEQEAVLESLGNVESHPFVRAAMEAGNLQLHGLWHDIKAGQLHHYDAAKGAFDAI